MKFGIMVKIREVCILILAIDIGNTNIKFGTFDRDEMVSSRRVSTERRCTADEYGIIIKELLSQSNNTVKDVEGVVLSSVVPALNYTMEHACEFLFGQKPLVVNHTISTGITIDYDNPNGLGADRIVGMASAYHNYGAPLIIIDFGTATTFNLLDKDGRFFGGAICPGIKTGAEALVSKTAKLPHIELVKPESIVGKDTRGCMQSGIIYGYAGLVKYMVDNFKALPEMVGAKVVATGGLSELISQIEPNIVDITDRALALKGLNYIYHLNKN
jgi:type III pantothenate kinase